MKYRVIFSVEAFIKIKNYIDKCDTEISGYGKITKNKEEGYFYVEDIFMLPQNYFDGTSTEFNNGKFYDDIIKNGGQPSEYRLWWHSHVDMPVHWSHQDTKTINDWDTEIPEDNWFLAIVGNKDGELLCRLDIWDPIRLKLDKLPWEIDFSDVDIEAKISKEVEDMKEAKYKLPFDKKKNFWLNQIDLPKREIIIPEEIIIDEEAIQ